MILHKYQGAGNDFLIADNRDKSISLTESEIQALCDRRYGVGADGVMLLEPGEEGYGFTMVYYNSDGSGGMMCGNGGRCIAAFAADCGITDLRFIAADGPHSAEILAQNGKERTVRLAMKDVTEIEHYPEGIFIDTGTRHLVVPVLDIENVDVENKGRELRYLPKFGPIGVNVNFTQRIGDTLHVRTYEKGVEAETFACGTGITAAAIADFILDRLENMKPKDEHTHIEIPIRAKRDSLKVDFVAHQDGSFRSVHLTGPATRVAKIEI